MVNVSKYKKPGWAIWRTAGKTSKTMSHLRDKFISEFVGTHWAKLGTVLELDFRHRRQIRYKLRNAEHVTARGDNSYPFQCDQIITNLLA